MPSSDLTPSIPGMDALQALRCAQLHLCNAKHLLQKGQSKRGITALYDSILFGMHYYVAHHQDCTDGDLADATGLFHLLSRQGIFDDEHAFNRLSLRVERILWQGSDCFDANEILVEVEEMLAKLGVARLSKSI